MILSETVRTKKYVWLNLNTGEFSNSWSPEVLNEFNITVEELVDEANKKEGWKLIEYTCVNDNVFEFYDRMKIK